jgi:CelD/BcsL family acetyltransferase involved in cellulose biosynthesis
MKVEVVRPSELGPVECRAWSEIQAADATFASPCLSPWFTRAIASQRDDVLVGIIGDGNRIAGFFPFQRSSGGDAVPSLERMADYEGVIALPHADWNACDLLRGCRLDAWNFRVLVGRQEQLLPYHDSTSFSPVLDLRRGFDAWFEAIQRPGSRLRRHLNAQRRTLERTLGPLRFEYHDASPESLRRLRAWKSAQYLRTGLPDHLATPWVAAMVESVRDAQSDDFSGTLSVLRAGDRIVAAHLGMRSRTVWHYWLPSYDRSLARCSPGLLLLIEMAKDAESRGIHFIDLGQGKQEYKARFSNASTSFARGSVCVASRAVHA